jgi:hypothetical protein
LKGRVVLGFVREMIGSNLLRFEIITKDPFGGFVPINHPFAVNQFYCPKLQPVNHLCIFHRFTEISNFVNETATEDDCRIRRD